jgi:hypothetical protein
MRTLLAMALSTVCLSAPAQASTDTILDHLSIIGNYAGTVAEAASAAKRDVKVCNPNKSFCFTLTGKVAGLYEIRIDTLVKHFHEKYVCLMSGDFDKMRCTDDFSAYISEYVKDASGWTALPAAATEQEAKTSKPDPSELSTAKHASRPGNEKGETVTANIEGCTFGRNGVVCPETDAQPVTHLGPSTCFDANYHQKPCPATASDVTVYQVSPKESKHYPHLALPAEVVSHYARTLNQTEQTVRTIITKMNEIADEDIGGDLVKQDMTRECHASRVEKYHSKDSQKIISDIMNLCLQQVDRSYGSNSKSSSPP